MNICRSVQPFSPIFSFVWIRVRIWTIWIRILKSYRIFIYLFGSGSTHMCSVVMIRSAADLILFWRDPDPSVKQIFLMFHFVQYMFYGKLNWTRAKYSLWFYDNMFRIFPGFDLERHLSLLKFLIICGIFFYSLQQSAGILQVLTFLKNLCCQTWSLTREQFTPKVQLPLSEQCHY